MNLHGAEEMRRTAQASQWLAELCDAPDDETVNRWLRWCEQDPENVRAYERVQQLWRQMDQVCSDPQEIVQLIDKPVRADGNKKYYVYLSMAATVLVAIALWWLLPLGSAPPTEMAPVGENRTTTLPDGSTLALGAKTTVAMDFSENRRVLQLSPGQAYFKVKPDKQRPFTVRTGELDVIAIGTAFDVKREPDRVVITVQEGLVEIAKSKPGASLWRVGGGYQFIYSSAAATTTLSAVDTSAALAWRDGRLEYVRTPLAAVISDINRYAQHPVELMNPAELSQLTFTGTVFTDSIDDWLTALPGALPLRVERTNAGRILIERK